MNALKTRPLLKKILIGAVALVVLVGLLGFLALPHFLRPFAENLLSEKLHRPVRIAELAINPYALSARIKGFSIGEKAGAGELLGFDELYVNVQAESLFRLAPVLSEVSLAGPRVHLVRNGDKSYNITDLIEEFVNKPDTEPKAQYAVYNIRISGGKVEFEDKPVGRLHRVSDLNVGVPFVSNLPSKLDVFVQPALALKVDGAPLSLGGKLRPFSTDKEAALQLDVTDLDLTRYADYVPVELAFKLPSARLDSKLALVFSQPEGKPATVRLSGSAALRKLDAQYKDGRPLFKLAALKVALKSFEPLAGKLDLDSVAVDGPELAVTRLKDGSLSLAHLVLPAKTALAPPKTDATKPKSEEKAAPLALSLAEFRLEGGRLAFTDQMPVKPVSASLEGLEAKVVKLALLGGVPKGKSDLSLGLKSLRLAVAGEKTAAFSLESISLAGVADTDKHELVLAEIKAVGGKLMAAREADGQFSLEKLLPPAPSSAHSAGKVPAPRKAAPDAPGWTVTVQKLALEGWAARLEDRQDKSHLPVLVEGLNLTVDKFSTAKGSTSSLTLKTGLGRRGSLTLAGTLGLAPLQGKFELDLKGLDLVPLQAYANHFPHMLVTRGALDGKGSLSFEMPVKAPLKAAFRGSLGLMDLSLIDKLNDADLLKWKRLRLSGIDLALGGKLPLDLSLTEVALSDFYAKLVVNADGTLALRKLVASDGPATAAVPTTAPTSAPTKTPPAIQPAPSSTTVATLPEQSSPLPPAYRVRVNRVSLQNGRVNYSDFFIKPNYSANLTGLGGSVTGLSSEPGTTAVVDLAGAVDGTAPLKIAGKVNPLSQELYLDLTAAASGVELAGLSAYSGRYAGYAIEKGKLSVDIRYSIQNRKLQAENHVFLDQLTFGEKVDSPDATKLPVLLAVALLRNSRGEIDINLPVSGSLDDPQFSVGGIVIKVILNLLAKAVTAPFVLLGNLFGGGEELGWLEFDGGRTVIKKPEEEKLQKLAKALIDRTSLRLDIVGRADAQADGDGYKRAQLERKVKTQKLKETVGKGEDAGALNEVVVSKEEWPKYLAQAYKAESFAKPKNLIGLAKSLPPAEMEKLILDNIPVTDDNLRRLAELRARAAENWLINTGKVPATRVFVVAPKLTPDKPTASDARAKAGLSRVDFVLK